MGAGWAATNRARSTSAHVRERERERESLQEREAMVECAREVQRDSNAQPNDGTRQLLCRGPPFGASRKPSTHSTSSFERSSIVAARPCRWSPCVDAGIVATRACISDSQIQCTVRVRPAPAGALAARRHGCGGVRTGTRSLAATPARLRWRGRRPARQRASEALCGSPPPSVAPLVVCDGAPALSG